MKFKIYKTNLEIGNYLYNFNLFYLIHKFYYFNKLSFYKNKKLFLFNFIKMNKYYFFYFLANTYIYFNNKFVYNYIINSYNKYIKIIFEINLKNELKKVNLDKKIIIYLSEIRNFKYNKTFILCCKFKKKYVKHFGLSFYRKKAENNSYRNLFKTILL
ncbi:hypothetical protein CRP_093 [Candidatus Carsonella ruddii PV]|uniref:Uncharacterized protein n=1 Tax=Carsonella ruddii (strain PV) TaxID=387662 RepID=Q05FP7_CARRP|nr:hypothetical protein [Candidatus Carsonella ruddii]BAF35124.1 hypothetical protein CRP_093 [Candidatus Carsonella ruddii PV]